jgi:carboxymethylenebutenolidase
MPIQSLDRRSFMLASAAAGYALAARPVLGAVVQTSEEGLRAGAVEIPAKGRSIPGYAARPADDKRAPLVLVVHEIFGVHEYIRDVCRRLAHQGHAAIAPDLFARQGAASVYLDIQELIREVVAKVPDAQVLDDLDSTARYGVEAQNADGARLGITGFCWGGRIVWLYAAHSRELRAGVAWYGRLAGTPSPLTPKSPLDLAGSLRAPVLGLYAGQDQGIPLRDVEEMQARLKASGSPSEIHVYPEAQHGFHADYRPSYDEAAAKDGWRRLTEWFRKYGAG